MMNDKSDPSVGYSSPMNDLICNLCGLEFSQQNYLMTHIKYCKDVENSAYSLGADTSTFEYVDCTEACESQVPLDIHNIKCETSELKFDIKSEEIEFAETTITGTTCTSYTEQPIKHLKKETPEESFECDDKAVQSSHFEDHIKVYKIEKQHYQKDTICDYTNADSFSRARHISSSFKCSVSDTASTDTPSLSKHVRHHAGEKPFTCTMCDYASVEGSMVTRHIAEHIGEEQLKCTVCNYTCAKPYMLTRHMKFHTEERPFKCTMCCYAGAKRSKLIRHMGTHTGEKPFKCTVCDYACKDPSNLTKHILRSHKGEKPFKCTLCNFSSTNRSTLTKHMKTHTVEKPFTCNMCFFACKDRSSLTKHMRTHVEEKPFTCDLSEYSCTERMELIQHRSTHTDLKLFKCNYCDDSSCVTMHTSKHTREELFKCSKLDYGTSHDNIQQHMRTQLKTLLQKQDSSEK